jgi:beta-lactamase class A
MRGITFAAAMASLVPAVALAQSPPPPPVESIAMLDRRAAELIAIFNDGGDVAATFAPEFLAQIPEAQIRALAAQLTGQLGKAVRVTSLKPAGASRAALVIGFEKGSATMGMALDPGPTAKIAGLGITGTQTAAVAGIATLADAAAAFKALPGQTGFVVADLSPKAAPLAALEADRPLAIGSTFKLVILAELVRAIDAGARKWDDAIVLDGTELPAGGFNQMPKGTSVPLRKLAEEMIRISDNSATDVLIRTLGREKIEAMQARVGIKAPAANVPFLTTMELFKLKGVGQGALGRRYLALDLKAKRKLLAGEVAATPGSAVGALFANGKPVLIDRLEWFASPSDLARVMQWLDAHRTTVGGKEAMRILAINPGIGAALAKRFAYVGYKGGSEPGVISMTALVRDLAGKARVVSASWNNPAAAVDELAFVALVNRAVELLSP